MKISEKLADVLPMPSASFTAPCKADAWQAQLERAWLDNWRGDRPEAPSAPTSDEAQAASAPAATQSDRAELVSLSEVHPIGRAGRVLEKHMIARNKSDGGSSVVAPGRRSPEVPVRTTLNGAGSVGGHLVSAPLRPQAQVAMSGLGLGDVAGAAAAQAQHHSALHLTPFAQPARAFLQVAMTDDTAQVTLRDATLSSTEAARLPQAIAHQLLESGLASVRLYVNGRVSQHCRRDHDPARQTSQSDIGSTDPLHINSLERK